MITKMSAIVPYSIELLIDMGMATDEQIAEYERTHPPVRLSFWWRLRRRLKWATEARRRALAHRLYEFREDD